MSDPFVVDAVCHPYNFTPENLNGRYGQMFTDVMYSAYPLINPGHRLTREEWERDWQPDEFIETMLLESPTDMICVHTLPIFDAYHDGLVSIEKGAGFSRSKRTRVPFAVSVNCSSPLPPLTSVV